MTSIDRMMDDMHDHFSNRLRRLVTDHADTCRRGGVDTDGMLKIIISGLVFEAAFASCAYGYDEEAFLSICRKAIDLLMENQDILEKGMN